MFIIVARTVIIHTLATCIFRQHAWSMPCLPISGAAYTGRSFHLPNKSPLSRKYDSLSGEDGV